RGASLQERLGARAALLRSTALSERVSNDPFTFGVQVPRPCVLRSVGTRRPSSVKGPIAVPHSERTGLSRARDLRYGYVVKTTVPLSQSDQLDTDQDIITRVLSGNSNAFQILIERYSDPLY